MAPRTASGCSDDVVNEILKSVEETLANITQTMQQMVIMNQGNRNPNQHQFTRMTKVEFPKFLGDDVKGWIFRCEQFFSIDEIPDNQKVRLISVHLFDTALLWHKQFIKLNGKNVTWNVYKDVIIQRFGTEFDDPMVEISEENVVSFYLGGLPQEIEMGVRMFKPKTLVEVYWLTNLQKASLNYAPSYKCPSQLYSLVVLEKDEEDEENLDELEDLEEEQVEEIIRSPQISLNALNGNSLIVDLKTVKINEDSLGHLKFYIWNWPKRGRKGAKCKVKNRDTHHPHISITQNLTRQLNMMDDQLGIHFAPHENGRWLIGEDEEGLFLVRSMDDLFERDKNDSVPTRDLESLLHLTHFDIPCPN
ncbi:hypothetical protein Tco_0549052 [Tanacetum coccineum]